MSLLQWPSGFGRACSQYRQRLLLLQHRETSLDAGAGVGSLGQCIHVSLTHESWLEARVAPPERPEPVHATHNGMLAVL